MPLQPTDAPARDDGSMVSFSMRDAERLVRCQAQQGALDSVERSRTGSAGERLERFRRHRAAFEAVASELYDAGLPLRITADHMSRFRAFAIDRR